MEALDTDVGALVGRLTNLHEIFRVQGEILCYGEATVAPLTELLLSPPSTFPEPRVAAAECLGAIGGDKAVNALIRVLDFYDSKTLGPVQRFAEETVRNAAARRLARFREPHVIAALLSALQRDHLIGAGQALATMGEAAAIPYLIECLEDDYKKEKATEALRVFGHAAVPHLCEAIERPRSVRGVEPPLSQERRSRAAELLGQLKAREALPALEIGLHDESEEVRIACSVALTGLEIATEEILYQLIAGLGNPDLLVRKNCEEGLRKAGSNAVPLLAGVARGHAIHMPRGNTVRLPLNARLVAIKVMSLIQESASVLYLIALLKDPEEIVRYRSVAALQNFADIQVRAALERVAREDSSKRVRMRAREALQMPTKGKVAGLIERLSG
jgi:HEAT repeat protein